MTLNPARSAARSHSPETGQRIHGADPATLDLLLSGARSHKAWKNTPVDDAQIQEIYEILKWGPTSHNQQPARYLFVRSQDAKEKLVPALDAPNIPKVLAAPVTAIICYDQAFFDRLPELYPQRPQVADKYRNDAQTAWLSAFRNGTLQGAYFMVAARAVGLDVGPISGFENSVVDDAFLTGTTWKSNFLCNIGHGDAEAVAERLPRLTFDEVARII